MPYAKLEDITAQDIKNYYNYTDANRDVQIAMVMPMCIDLIYGYCNSDFQQKSRTEKPVIENSETVSFFTKYRPVASVTSITSDGTALVEDTDFFCDLDTGRVEKIQSDDEIVIYNKGPYWTTKRNAITITYVGGQVLPQDVVLVFMEIVGIYVEINTKVYLDIEGNERAVAYDKIPGELKAILDRYLQTYHV